jgi:hypothetical protein
MRALSGTPRAAEAGILGEGEVLDAIAAAHVDRADGARVQAVLSPLLLSRGFEFEKTGLFKDVEVPGLRPDLFHPGLMILGECHPRAERESRKREANARCSS